MALGVAAFYFIGTKIECRSTVVISLCSDWRLGGDVCEKLKGREWFVRLGGVIDRNMCSGKDDSV